MQANEFSRREAVRALLGAAALSSFGAFAQGGDTYPSRPIRLVVPFPAGNTADIVGRVLADRLQKALAQPVIVDNRAGAAGIIGVDAVAKADKDGYTLLLTTASPIAINPAVYRKLPYNAERDLQPIAAASHQPMVLLAGKSVPVHSVQELVRYMASNGERVSYASVGPGTFSHLAMETFSRAIGAHPLHVPYKGASAAHTDLIGGQVGLMFDGLASGSTQVRSGRLQALAVTSGARSPFLPDVPTVAESAVPALRNFEVSAWVGMFAPAGTPPAALSLIQREVAKIVATRDFRSALLSSFMMAAEPQTPEQFAQEVRQDTAKWSRAARDAKLAPLD